jgi:hypothetical protein
MFLHSTTQIRSLMIAGCLIGISLSGVIGCARQDSVSLAGGSVERAMAATAQSADDVALVSGGDAVRRPESTRKIIYTADIDLVVKDFAQFEKRLPGLIADQKGVVAERKTDRQHGDHRGGRWIIRVPVQGYDAFLSGLNTLGFARSRSETSDDVTKAYVDLEARISNKRKLEERIIAMLQERPGKLTELMAMERELSRVREEIERMEGRLRVLTDQTSLATVKLRVSEEATYEPPAAPTLGDRIAASWGGSIGAIRRIAAGLVIASVALIPWLAIFLPLTAGAYWGRKRYRHADRYEAPAT